jgi:hypothetical protein
MIKFLGFVFIIWVIASVTLAQNQLVTISGVVLDSASEQPLPFVTIQIKDKAISRTSDAAGYFSITAHINDTLVFTRLGYHQYLFAVVKNNKALIIKLKENAFLLKEAIIYGSYTPYGSAKWNNNIKETKQVTFKATPSLEPGVIIKFGGKDKKLKARSTLVYDSTVNSDKVKKHLMGLYSISEATYFRKLEEFNKKNSDAAFLTNQDEIISMLVHFFALKEP